MPAGDAKAQPETESDGCEPTPVSITCSYGPKNAAPEVATRLSMLDRIPLSRSKLELAIHGLHAEFELRPTHAYFVVYVLVMYFVILEKPVRRSFYREKKQSISRK